MPARRATWVALPVLVSGVLLAACGDDRPSVVEWSATWATERARVPAADDLRAGGSDRCDALVGELREVKDRLEPTPADALDATVSAWLDHAERIAFDCPEDPAELASQYAELEVLAAEIDAGLAAES